MLALLAVLTSTTAAQVQRNILHVYVDPIFGDDAEAFASNPGMGSNPPPFAQHPDVPHFPSDVPRGKIRHAPYSFRTLTGTSGVKAYLDAIDQLLYQETATAIIHCLPGLYGPFLAGPGATMAPLDPRSGLQYNGESWPFTLRWKWSLQGTSALDTIFDGRNRPTAIILVQAESPEQLSHQDSIIDSLTIRGARSDNQSVSPFNCTGAGICVSAQAIAGGRGTQIGVTISNCFLVDNHVGVAVDNNNDPLGEPSHVNHPRIINNTFARNWIGLWSGSMDPAQPNIGTAPIFLINDIFDSWRPGVGGVGTTPFVGIHPYEITVGAVKATGASTYTDLNPIRSYCAWEKGRENLAVALPNWPTPAVQAYTPPFPDPRVDIRAYTGVTPGLARGTLYINDIFRNAGIQAVAGIDYSAHDFRLAASPNKEPTAPGLRELSPLVNQGIYVNALAGGSIGGIRMARNRFSAIALPPDIESPPGPSGELNATLHAWDLDCEGFGNPRAVNRSYYSVGTGDYARGHLRLQPVVVARRTPGRSRIPTRQRRAVRQLGSDALAFATRRAERRSTATLQHATHGDPQRNDQPAGNGTLQRRRAPSPELRGGTVRVGLTVSRRLGSDRVQRESPRLG